MKDGGSAFPCFQPMNPDRTWSDTFEGGMTLLDYFAAAALTGLLASEGYDESFQTASYRSFKHADAMLAEREKEATP